MCLALVCFSPQWEWCRSLSDASSLHRGSPIAMIEALSSSSGLKRNAGEMSKDLTPDNLIFVTFPGIQHKLFILVFLYINSIVETETASGGGRENARPHANAPEIALPDGNAHLDARAGSCLATPSSFPSSAWMGKHHLPIYPSCLLATYHWSVVQFGLWR